METKAGPLIALSVFSLVVMAGSVLWAIATDAQPHVSANPAPTVSGPGFTICARGNYPAYVVLTQTKVKSAVAQPGKCVTQTVANSAAEYAIQVFGLDGATPFAIGTDEIGGDGTEKVTATGSADNPDWTTG